VHAANVIARFESSGGEGDALHFVVIMCFGNRPVKLFWTIEPRVVGKKGQSFGTPTTCRAAR